MPVSYFNIQVNGKRHQGWPRLLWFCTIKNDHSIRLIFSFPHQVLQQKSNSLLITRNVSPLSHPFQVKIKGNFPVGFQYNAFVLYLFKFEINVSEIASFNIYITILKTSKAKTIKGKSAAINKCNISDSFSQSYILV